VAAQAKHLAGTRTLTYCPHGGQVLGSIYTRTHREGIGGIHSTHRGAAAAENGFSLSDSTLLTLLYKTVHLVLHTLTLALPRSYAYGCTTFHFQGQASQSGSLSGLRAQAGAHAVSSRRAHGAASWACSLELAV
jgi:hypothetical protein